jgi:hypothetical protein
LRAVFGIFPEHEIRRQNAGLGTLECALAKLRRRASFACPELNSLGQRKLG